jgi:hypothetical protein
LHKKCTLAVIALHLVSFRERERERAVVLDLQREEEDLMRV